jgi:hypothetical protein
MTGAQVDELDGETQGKNLESPSTLCHLDDSSIEEEYDYVFDPDALNEFLSRRNPPPYERTECPDDLMEDFLADCTYPQSGDTGLPNEGTAGALVVRHEPAHPGGSNSGSHNGSPNQEDVPVLPGPTLTLEPLVPGREDRIVDNGLQSGLPFVVPSDYYHGQFCFSSRDCAMMRIYQICDQANTPRYLADKILAQMKIEIQRNDFDPCDPAITKRDAFMARMHRKFPSPPPEPVRVRLESFPGEDVTIFRFDVVRQLQDHLLRPDLYSTLNKLNVHQEHRWDQSFLPPFKHYREVTDGSWYRKVVDRYIERHSTTPVDDLHPVEQEAFLRFVITLELYTDSTGTDQKESFSLEPVMMSTGLLHSEFVGKQGSRFIIGYIPSLSNMKSSAAQSKQNSTVKGFGSHVRDYHK